MRFILDAHINRLRRKLGNDRRGRTPIRTVRSVGCLLLAAWEPAPYRALI
jgi:DNA-binding response OmpR family regulator